MKKGVIMKVETTYKKWCEMITIYNQNYRDEYELSSWSMDSNGYFIMHLKRR